MGCQNKVALGVAALGGALAAGDNAQAQIFNETIPTNYYQDAQGTLSFNNNFFTSGRPALSVLFIVYNQTQAM